MTVTNILISYENLILNANSDLGVAVFLLKQKQQKLLMLNYTDQLFRTNLVPESTSPTETSKNCINI